MKIIAPAALVAATLVLTAAVPALADGDHGTPRGHKGSPVPATHSSAPVTHPSVPVVTYPGVSSPTTMEVDEEADSDLSPGLLPLLVGRVL